jgi:hypothetical protein
VPAPAPAPAPAPRPPWRFQGDAVGTVTSGLAPALDAGGSIAGTLFFPKIPLGLRGQGSLFLPTTAAEDGARASFDLFYLGGAVCPTLRRPAVVAMLCFGGHLGVLRSHPETLDRGIADKSEPLWSAVSEARVTLPVAAPLGLTAGVSSVLPLLRPSFGYTRSDTGKAAELHKVSPLAVAADVGIGLLFP